MTLLILLAALILTITFLSAFALSKKKMKMNMNIIYKNIHIVPNPTGGWLVKEEHSLVSIASTKTKKEANSIAKALAKERQVELVIHNKDGKIADKDSFGNDSENIKDKIH
jgi:hypothetical protein